MTSTYRNAILMAGAAMLLASCGSSSGGGGGGSTGVGSGTPGFFITIHNLAFSPLELRVPPGGTVTVMNQDGMAHSVTSEATSGAYTPGAVGGVQFDTGAFMGQATFTIPANAADGTVIPYYCSVHRNTMATPNATIRVDASAQPSAPPGSAPPSSPPSGY